MDVRKNLYDLQYQTDLNTLNISLIILATVFITFIFSPLPIDNKQAVFVLKLFSFFIAIVMTIILIVVFNSKLSQIREMIEELRKEKGIMKEGNKNQRPQVNNVLR